MIDLTQPCIIAPNKPNPSGYHLIQIDGKKWRAHRYSYIMTYGPPPLEKPLILHKCNNRACWNPGHLEAGTLSDNQYDSVKAGTHVDAKKSHCKNGHELSGGNLVMSDKKFGKRTCRTCHIRHQRKYYNTL